MMRPTREQVDAAIHLAPDQGDLVGNAPAVDVNGFVVRVCYICRACQAHEGGTCHACDDRTRWQDICPPRYRQHATLAQLTEGPDPWHGDQVAELTQWASEPPLGAVLGMTSRPGRRKTTAAFAVIRYWLDCDSHSVAYTTATDMLLDLTARQFEPDAHLQYTDPDVLLLDELGDRDDSLTAFQKQQFHRIIDHRYRHQKKLIWTSNLSLNQLKTWCSERSWERLWDGALVLQIGGASTRRLAS